MTHEVILLHIIIAAEIVPRAQQTLDADMVILSAGVKPNDDLYNALRAAGHPSVWKVGDANICGKIVKAVQNGSKYAVGLN